MRIVRAIGEHVSAFANGIMRVFRPRHDDVPFERIVFIAGINATQHRIGKLEKFLQKQFPGKEVVIVREYYMHTQEEKVEQMITRTVEILRSDVPTIVMGHSFGGIVALAALGRLEDTRHIKLLVTLGSPHTMDEFGVLEAKKRHNISATCAVPVLTFGGLIDAVVPDEMSHFNGEVGHISLPCTHVAFLRTSRTHKEVLAGILQYFILAQDDTMKI